MNYKLRELHKNGYLVAVIKRKSFKQLEHVFGMDQTKVA
jgi:hypothetical protein